jgi:hypothetical protein
VVTAGPALLDSSGRRIVIQDATAATEVFVPSDGPRPGVGVHVRVTGRMGAAYGAPRLRGHAVEVLGTGTAPSPMSVTGALGRNHAWRLVVIRGRVEDVKKLGERWVAEVIVGSARVAVTGQPGAGIPISAVHEGGTLTAIGIVRLAYPSASDKRPTLLPRSPADLTVGIATADGSTASASDGTDAGSGSGTPTEDGSTAADGAAFADLADLASRHGDLVRVGGLITELTSDGFRLDDATAVARVVLAGEAAAYQAIVEPGDAINLTGLVATLDDGAPGLLVDDVGGIVLGADPLAGGVTTDPGARPSPEPPSVSEGTGLTGLQAGLAGELEAIPGMGAGLASLALISMASVAVTILRRRHAERLLRSRVARRLAAIAGPVGDAERPSVP